MVSALASAFLAEPQEPKDWSQIAESAKYVHAFQLHLQSGFYLYNPHEPIFGGVLESPRAASQESLEMAPLQDLIDTSARHQDFYGTDILIQPLMHLEDDAIETARNLIQTEHAHHNFHTGRWRRSSPATRRDVSRIFRHFSESRARIIFLLSPPVEGEPLDTAVFMPPQEEVGYGMLCRESSTLLRI